jgi:hypothetical protein
MGELLDTTERRSLYGLAAEVRAVEEGHNARVLPDGSVLVKSESHPGSYRISLPVPCKHAAVAARRLEREGLARWEDGTWRLRDRAQVRGARLLLARTVRRRPRLATEAMAGAADAA